MSTHDPLQAMDDPTSIAATPYSLSETQPQSTTIEIRDRVSGNPSREFTTELLCTVCPQPGDLRCSVCGICYCSADCKELDRCTHEFFCKSLDGFTNEKHPSHHHVRAILFPEDKNDPEWTWVQRSEDRASICLPQLHEKLPTDDVSTVRFKTYRDKKTSRMPHHWLNQFNLFQTNRGNQFSSINKSVLNLGPPGHLQTFWGPIVVVAGKKEPRSSGPLQGPEMDFYAEDLEMVDVWQAFQEILYGDDKTPCVVNVPRYPLNSLPALKINCFGDRVRFHPDKDPNSNAAIYEAVTVPNRKIHSETEQWPSLIAFMLGLPWLCRLVHNSLDLWDRDPDGSYNPDPVALANDELGLLSITVKRYNPEDQPGTQAPTARQSPHIAAYPTQHYGSLILVNMYGGRIRPEHVRLANLFAEENGFAGRLHRQELLWSGEINVTHFERYWDEKKRDNDVPGVDLRGVPSPVIGREDQLGGHIENLIDYDGLFLHTVWKALQYFE